MTNQTGGGQLPSMSRGLARPLMTALAAALLLASTMMALAPAAGPDEAEASVSRGTVAGWVSFKAFSKSNYADVTITYYDGGQRSQTKRVYNYATFGCAKYAPLTGGYFLTGNCFEFTNIRKNQTVSIKVRYQEGLIRYKSDWFSWWESFNWMGVIKNW